MHDFRGPSLQGPGNSALLDNGGMLWGVRGTGGNAFAGDVYTVNATTKLQKTIYTFTGGADGGAPSGPLVKDGSTLYGIAQSGGANQGGVIYSINEVTGAQSVAYDFPAGASPNGSLFLVGNTLYGTTTTVPNTNVNYGIVFSYTPSSNSFSTVYSFTGGPDGAAPNSGLIVSGGTLYGASSSGATYNAGVVFSLTP